MAPYIKFVSLAGTFEGRIPLGASACIRPRLWLYLGQKFTIMISRDFFRLCFLVCLGLVALPCSVFGQRNYAQEEYVILSGGPALRGWEEYRAPKDQHDRYAGNFIRSARIRIDQLRAQHGPPLNISWLVFRPGYETREREDAVKRPPYQCPTAEVTSLAAERGVKLVWFNNTDALISYLNNRGGRKLSGFEFYGHSNKFCFLFDYSNDILGVSTCYLHSADLRRLRRGLFTSDAYVHSYGCHTGEFMSRIWKKQTGVPMVGAVGKTDFSAIKDNLTLPTVNGRWTR